MRKLQGSDLFDVIKIVKLANLDMDALLEKFTETADTDINDEVAVKTRGMRLAKYVFELVLERAETLQAPVHEFLAKLKGCTKEEIEALPLEEYFGLYKEFAQKEELKGFLSLSLSYSAKAITK